MQLLRIASGKYFIAFVTRAKNNYIEHRRHAEGEFQSTAALWIRPLSNAIFTKRPVVAHARRWLYPSGSSASESDASTGRLQKTASPVRLPAADAAFTTLQASSCMPAAPSLFIMMGEKGERDKEGEDTEAQRKQQAFCENIKKYKNHPDNFARWWA